MTKTHPADRDEMPSLPPWVPPAARHYLAHTENGLSIRELARGAGVHASTILRQVRRFETRRDDPLVDEALRRLGTSQIAPTPDDATEDGPTMTAAFQPPAMPNEETVNREARRILRRLIEPGACLAIAKDMEKAVVVREGADGRTVRTAVVDREIAEAMALKDWIGCQVQGRVTRYTITPVGRSALKRLLAVEDGAAPDESIQEQHGDWTSPERPQRRRPRYNLSESPLAALSRRRDKGGEPFLSGDLVAAGERLREDFELAQLGPRVTQNWERFLGGERGSFAAGTDAPRGSQAARDRIAAALAELGPGLGDVALRCCCFLEGLEATEQRMGWSARSGKIVLRIALQRLKRHYDERQDGWSPMIG